MELFYELIIENVCQPHLFPIFFKLTTFSLQPFFKVDLLILDISDVSTNGRRILCLYVLQHPPPPPGGGQWGVKVLDMLLICSFTISLLIFDETIINGSHYS